MPVSLSHPLVAQYLARLDTAALVLPPSRRAELRAELEGHLAEALRGVPDDDEVTVRQAIDRLGDPADIVDAERETGSAPAPGSATQHSFGPPPAPSPWGPVEVGAVALLTVGTFVLPVVGPAIGLVLAWVSQQWTRRHKIVATVWTLVPVLVVVLAGAWLLVVRDSGPVPTGPNVSVVTPAPAEGTP